MKFLLSIFTCALFSTALAQPGDEIRKNFPQQDVVLLNYNNHLTFSLKNGVPVAQSEYETDKMILNSKNASLHSRYKIFHGAFNELTGFDAYTMVPDGSKYKKLKIGDVKTSNSVSRSVFYDDVKETSFDFPGLTENAIAHVSYSEFHKDAHLISPFYFSSYLPLINSSYKVTFPNDIQVKYIIKNDEKNIISFKEEKKKKETTYTWTANNIATVDPYADAPSDEYYRPHVIVYISSYQNDNGTHPFLNTLDDLHRWNASFTKDLNKSQDASLKKIVDSLTAGLTTEMDRAENIYRWVQQNIRYVAFENGEEGFRPRQAAEVCSKRYGDCKDMSSIITQMLKMAGIKAYYTWIGTRDLPYDYSEIPLPIVDNHMISTALIDNKWIFLDGTDPNAMFETPPSSIQGKEALVAIGENEFKVIRVPVAEPSATMILDSTFIDISENNIKGFETVYYHGYAGNQIYNALMYVSGGDDLKDYVKTKMGKASNKFILGDFKINRINPAKNIININARFEIPDYVKKAGNELYINLNLEKLFEGQLIDTAKRKIAKQIDYKYIVKQYHILRIPAGYKSTYVPRDFSIDTDAFSFKISYELKDNSIVACQQLVSKLIMINPSQFNDWNKGIKAVMPQYKESIVLEKL